MDHDAVLATIRESLRAIAVPRLFETERGYQGALIVELSKRLPQLTIIEQGALVEQEYQKRLADHGLTIRPDLIIHVPFDPARHADRTQGNIIVFELKRRASPREAREDFQNLCAMMRVLHYPVGIFVNIDSSETHFAEVPQDIPGWLVAFAVKLENGSVLLAEKGT